MAEAQIVVTGASKGIGAEIVTMLAAKGENVVGLSRTGTVPAGTGFACDMTDEASVVEAFKKIGERGPIKALVNNAGVHILGAIESLSVESFNETYALNTTAVMVASREAYPHLLKNGGGVVVNMGSFFGKLGVKDNLAYCSSKAAVAAMTRCMAVEWAKDGIRAVNVAPGYIETDLNRDYLQREKVVAWMGSRIPVGAPGVAEDVAKLVSWLCIEQVNFLTGETIYIDGAQGVNH